MRSQPYQAGVELRDLNGRPSAGIDIRGDNGVVHMTVTVNAERGACTTVVDFFDPHDLDDVVTALRTARQRAGLGVHETGAAA